MPDTSWISFAASRSATQSTMFMPLPPGRDRVSAAHRRERGRPTKAPLPTVSAPQYYTYKAEAHASRRHRTFADPVVTGAVADAVGDAGAVDTSASQRRFLTEATVAPMRRRQGARGLLRRPAASRSSGLTTILSMTRAQGRYGCSGRCGLRRPRPGRLCRPGADIDPAQSRSAVRDRA